MPQTIDADSSRDKQIALPDDIARHNPTPLSSAVTLPRSLRWIFIGGVVLLLTLLVASIFHPSMAERVKFFTTNALSLLVLVVIVVQAIIYRKQWGAMDRNLELTADMIDKMQGQLDATKEAVEMAKGQLVAMQHQEQAQFSQLEESRKLVTQNERAVKAAEDSLKTANQNMIYAQRAYITITHGSVQATGNEVLFSLRLENSGSTPASRVRILAVLDVVKTPPRIDPTLPDLPNWATVGLIGPRAFITKLVTNKQSLLTEGLELVQRRERRLCCWGVVEYFDIFGELRRTKFCFQDSPFIGSFGPYGDGNEAD